MQQMSRLIMIISAGSAEKKAWPLREVEAMPC